MILKNSVWIMRYTGLKQVKQWSDYKASPIHAVFYLVSK